MTFRSGFGIIQTKSVVRLCTSCSFIPNRSLDFMTIFRIMPSLGHLTTSPFIFTTCCDCTTGIYTVTLRHE